MTSYHIEPKEIKVTLTVPNWQTKKEETKMKTFSLKDVYEKEPCEGEWERFHRICGYKKWSDPFDSIEIANIKHDNPTWYKWLLEKGLVEKNKKVPKISIGMRIPKDVLCPDDAYLICVIDHKTVQLIGVKGTSHWSKSIQVKNTQDISLQEFAILLSSARNRAEEIANKLIPPKED